MDSGARNNPLGFIGASLWRGGARAAAGAGRAAGEGCRHRVVLGRRGGQTVAEVEAGDSMSVFALRRDADTEVGTSMGAGEGLGRGANAERDGCAHTQAGCAEAGAAGGGTEWAGATHMRVAPAAVRTQDLDWRAGTETGARRGSAGSGTGVAGEGGRVHGRGGAGVDADRKRALWRERQECGWRRDRTGVAAHGGAVWTRSETGVWGGREGEVDAGRDGRGSTREGCGSGVQVGQVHVRVSGGADGRAG
ncbi:hypothetical protein B0H14DRAFT_3126738 [Mycena olivaceomarginata]|nr:hypothetical protein B0H14DRAFT_3126738 [Mycena olivaceomarginata]